MAKFTDAEGREWEVRITHGHIKPLKRDVGLDLQDVLKPDDKTLVDILSDPERTGRLLWVVCGREAKAAGLSEEEFAYRFDGETVEGAVAAVYEAVLEFFPTTRKAAKRVGTAFRKVLAATQERADTEMGIALGRKTDELISKLSGGGSAD